LDAYPVGRAEAALVRAVLRTASVVAICTTGLMAWLIVLSDLYGNKEYLTYPRGRGPFSWLAECSGGLLCGFFAAWLCETNGAKLRTTFLLAAAWLALNARRATNLGVDGVGLGSLSELAPYWLALVWIAPWVGLGALAEVRLLVRAELDPGKPWTYTAADGRTYPARSPRARPVVASALCAGAIGLWALAVFLAVLVCWSPAKEPFETVIALFLLGFFGEAWWAIGRRWRTPSAEFLARHDGPRPILYLRSFLDDGSSLKAGKPWGLSHGVDSWRNDSVERRLAKALGRVGPLVAVGRPGDTLPPLGAARLYLGDEHWQAVVSDLLARCQFVVLHAGGTAGLQWEMDAVRLLLPPDRVVVFVPPAAWFWRFGRNRAYQRQREQLEAGLRCHLPERIGRACLLCFQPGEVWEGRLLRKPCDVDSAHPLRQPLLRLVKDKKLRW
jgi:hypothetical protein